MPIVEVGSVIRTRMQASAPVELWRSVRRLPDFWRLLQLRMASQFGDGLFQAGLAGALLFNPDRAADPMAVASAFAVLFLPYSLLGPFAGALMDRWDRRLVLIGANSVRLAFIVVIGTILAVGAGDVLLLCTALLANGMARFVGSGLSASLPHVVPREEVVKMNSLATAVGAVAAFLGANFMLVPRWLGGGGDHGAAVVIFTALIPVTLALLLSFRFGPHVLGPDDTKRAIHGSAVYAVLTGWLHGVRTVLQRPTVAAALAGLAAHRMVVGINSLVILLLVHRMKNVDGDGLGAALVFFAATGLGAFLANVLNPVLVRRWGRYATANAALVAAAIIQSAGAGLVLPVMVVCGFLLGLAGQVIKLSADAAMQIDVDDALRGHVFAVQDALFWVSFIAAVSVAAVFIPEDGRAPGFVLCGSLIYLVGLVVHALVGRRSQAA
ncbi:MFS transporter [Mycobacterium asiaticum]|uniref:MFS transporter n=1 Tax=Mycobacterium asiaticum TaxID=1790 RepID=UPI0012DB2709|nr:MFS transporter [Mycobacterium asiaticum]